MEQVMDKAGRKAEKNAGVCNPRRMQNGFTLIEMAIITIIVGVLMVGILQLYRAQMTNARYVSTEKKMQTVMTKLQEYYMWNGTYPCPARRDAAPGDADYGVAQCRPAVTDPCPAGVVCTNVATRDTAYDADTDNDFVMIGTVPFRTLSSFGGETEFFEDSAFDDFGMKLSYAVTEAMTDVTRFNVSRPANTRFGVIDVRDENNRSVIAPEGGGHFLLFSHGQNNRGAFSRSGAAMGACTAIVSGVPVAPGGGNDLAGGGLPPEFENCDNADGIFVNALLSFSENAYFDDIVMVGMSDSAPMWLPVAGADPNQPHFYKANLGNVGVGTTTPNALLDVSGDFMTSGLMHASRFCDLAGYDPADPDTVCVDPAILGGGGMDNLCPPGQVVVGIAYNRLICEVPVFNAPSGYGTCPANEFIIAVSNLGSVRCAPIM